MKTKKMATQLAAAIATTMALAACSTTGVPTASADPQPTLGGVWNPSVRGYGTVRPVRVFNGGDPTGDIWDITWASWGGERAIGRGLSYGIPPGATSVAESIKQPATIVAYNLGTCNGQLMYQAAKWYFPGNGETFDPAGHYNICTGDYVNGI
jgi:PAB1-binding protein PBP1